MTISGMHHLPARHRICLATALVAASVGGCSDMSPLDEGPTLPALDSAFVVSNPVVSSLLAARSSGASIGMAGGGNVVYVSLPEGTLPEGTLATIYTADRTSSITAPIVGGGFDPRTLAASAGDSLEIEVHSENGATISTATSVVLPARRPIVVRTSPTKGRRDVPLNSIMVVVFSEPIEPSTLTTSTIRLMSNGRSVPGRLGFHDVDSLMTVFMPEEPLAPGTPYELLISGDVSDQDGDRLEEPVTVSFETAPVPVASGPSVLVDASRDGGAWWYPQWAEEGGYNAALPHQGQALADYVRSRGFVVVELPRPYTITRELLDAQRYVIRASGFGSYSSGELDAYREWVAEGGRLLLLADHMKFLATDELAATFGLQLAGITRGANLLTTYATHPLTDGVEPLGFGVGSGLLSHPQSATILGWLSADSYLDVDKDETQSAGDLTAPAVFGVMPYGAGSIIFLTDVNMLEWMPQPLLDNLLAWLEGQ